MAQGRPWLGATLGSGRCGATHFLPPCVASAGLGLPGPAYHMRLLPNMAAHSCPALWLGSRLVILVWQISQLCVRRTGLYSTLPGLDQNFSQKGTPYSHEITVLLVLAAQALRLGPIFLPLCVFPWMASGTQPRAPYKHELPAASSRAPTLVCSLGSQTRLLPAREQSPVPTGGSPEHLQALSSSHTALLMPAQNTLGTAEHKLASSGLSRPQTQAGAGRRSG